MDYWGGGQSPPISNYWGGPPPPPPLVPPLPTTMQLFAAWKWFPFALSLYHAPLPFGIQLWFSPMLPAHIYGSYSIDRYLSFIQATCDLLKGYSEFVVLLFLLLIATIYQKVKPKYGFHGPLSRKCHLYQADRLTKESKNRSCRGKQPDIL